MMVKGKSIKLSRSSNYQKNRIVVDNHLLPTAPNLSVVSPTIVNSDPISQRNLTLGIATGAMLSECQSFSYLAITENTTTIPECE